MASLPALPRFPFSNDLKEYLRTMRGVDAALFASCENKSVEVLKMWHDAVPHPAYVCAWLRSVRPMEQCDIGNWIETRYDGKQFDDIEAFELKLKGRCH
jgi:hypothetical protein